LGALLCSLEMQRLRHTGDSMTSACNALVPSGTLLGGDTAACPDNNTNNNTNQQQ